MSTTTAPKPALTPPPGVKSNFTNPDSIVPLAQIVVGICISVVTLAFFLRCYVRIFVRRTWIWEDVFASIAWAGTVCYCSAVAATMAHYGGLHLWDITKEQSQQAGYWFSVATIFYGSAIPFTKLTILWLYRRVFVTKRWSVLDISIVALAVFQGCFYLGTTLLKIFQCTPRERIWDKDIKGTCVDTATILNTSGIFNVASDFLILFLPVYTILRLKMDTKKKVMVLMVFTFGLCAPAFSVAGLVQRLRSSANKDFTWNQPRIQFWGAAELTTGLLCFCLPELAILFRKKQPQSGYNYYPTDSYGKPLGSNAQQYGTQRSGTSRTSRVLSEKHLARPKVIRLDSGTSYGGDSNIITPYSPDIITPCSPVQFPSSPRSPHMAQLHRHYTDHPGHFSGHSPQSSVDQPGYFTRTDAERYAYNPLNTVTVKKEFTLEYEENLDMRHPGMKQPVVEHTEIEPAESEPSWPEQQQPTYWGQDVEQPQTEPNEVERPLIEERRPSYWSEHERQPATGYTERQSSDTQRPVLEQRRPSYWSQQMKPPVVDYTETEPADEERPRIEQRRPSNWSQQGHQPEATHAERESTDVERPVMEQRRPSYWAQRVPNLGM